MDQVDPDDGADDVERVEDGVEAAELADRLGACALGKIDAATLTLAQRAADDVVANMRAALAIIPAALRDELPAAVLNPLYSTEAEELADVVQARGQDRTYVTALRSLADLARLGFELWRHGLADDLRPTDLAPDQLVELEARIELARSNLAFMERIRDIMVRERPALARLARND